MWIETFLMANPQRVRSTILYLLLAVCVVLFVMRGVVSGMHRGSDLIHLYTASVLWIEGDSPYDGQQSVSVAERAGYGNPNHVSDGSFYPPPSIAALAPLGLTDWQAARLAWLVINLCCCVLLVWVLSKWLALKRPALRWLVASVLVLGWGPVATSLSLGQLAIVCSASVFAGAYCLNCGRAIPAGLLVGVGCLIKPQLGLGFLLLIALRREWRALVAGLVLIMLVSLIGVGRLMMTVPDWASQLSGNLADAKASGQMLDASLFNPQRYQMIDLHPLMYLVVPASWVAAAALGITALLAAAGLARLLKIGLDRATLLAVSGVGLLMLMPVYHRYYDAVVLLPLVVLVINSLVRDRRDTIMWLIGLSLVPLIQPTSALLVTIERRGIVPEGFAATWAWKHLLLQSQSWGLLVAAVALVIWTWKQRINDENSAMSDPVTTPNNQP